MGVPAGSYVLLKVSDTGHGMDAETLRHIFEPFFTTKEMGQGTGLGLSTVYGIIRQAGGAISVSSEPGSGTVFKIYLPRTEELPEPGQPAAADHKPGGAHTILLVEDEPGVRRMVRQALRRQGYTVLEAGSAAEALQLCQRHRNSIHLLVTDVVMPHMSGRQLAQQVRSLLPRMRTLFISGYAHEVVENAEGVRRRRRLHRQAIYAGGFCRQDPGSAAKIRREINPGLHPLAPISGWKCFACNTRLCVGNLSPFVCNPVIGD